MRIKNKIIFIYIFFLILIYHLLYFNQPEKFNASLCVKIDKKVDLLMDNISEIKLYLNNYFYNSTETIHDLNLISELFVLENLNKNIFIDKFNLVSKNRFSNKKISEHQYSFFFYDNKESQSYNEYKYNISLTGVENFEETKNIVENITNFNYFLINNKQIKNNRKFYDKFKIYQNIFFSNKIIKYDKYFYHKDILTNRYLRKFQAENELINFLDSLIEKNIYIGLNDLSYKYSIHLTPTELAMNLIELNNLVMKNSIKEIQYFNVFSIKKKYFNGYLKYLMIYIFIFLVISFVCKEIFNIYTLINNLRK